MKIAASILLLFIMLAQTFSSFVYDAAYYFNKNYIASNLCENRDKPMMHCNGKCYLAKQKQKENTTNQPLNENKNEHFQPQVFFLPEEISINPQSNTSQIFFCAVNNLTLADFVHCVFHPPCNC